MIKAMFFVLTACIMLDSQAQKPGSSVTVKALHEKYCQAIELKDSMFLKELFHDAMIVTGASGSQRNKEQEIKDALDAKYIVPYFKSRNLDFREFGQTVIVTGDLYWEIVLDGKSSQVERRFTFTYVKFNDAWQIVAQHLGRVPSSPK